MHTVGRFVYCLHLSSMINWWPLQSVPHLLLYDCWETSTTLNLIKRVWEMNELMNYCHSNILMHSGDPLLLSTCQHSQLSDFYIWQWNILSKQLYTIVCDIFFTFQAYRSWLKVFFFFNNINMLWDPSWSNSSSYCPPTMIIGFCVGMLELVPLPRVTPLFFGEQDWPNPLLHVWVIF